MEWESGNEITGLYVHLLFSSVLYFCQQWMKVPMTSQSHQQLFSVLYFYDCIKLVAINRSLTVGLIYIFLIGLMLNIFSHHCFIIYIIYNIYFFEDFIQYILIILNPSNTHFFFGSFFLFCFAHFRNWGIVFWFWSCKGFYILWIFKSYELTFKYFPIVYTDWLPFW